MPPHLRHPIRDPDPSPETPGLLDRSVVLVGLMGAGKTAVGRRLAKRLSLPFADADQEIEQAAGCSVKDIFSVWGEPAFRDCERRVIRRLLSQAPLVLSTGGGAFIDPQTRALVLERGIAVWLRANLEVLLSRTARRNTRPLLNEGNPRRILSELMAKRHPIYAHAHIVVDTTECSVDHTTDRVERALEPYLRSPVDIPAD
ncbi:MAG: shikimate kinase [Rhodospirillaceae bacterium]|nr:shikimate kinase [Rhodospirillaceae bacterium]MCA8933664.1 shikimate kinase [Rhodospirillaceae bacterium]